MIRFFNKKKKRGRPPKGKKKKLVFFLFFLLVALGLSFVYWAQREKIINFTPGVLGVKTGSKSNNFALESLLNLLKEKKEWGREALPSWLKIKFWPAPAKNSSTAVVAKWAIVSDSHEDDYYFPLILKRIQQLDVDFVVHLGDLTNDGEIKALEQARKYLEQTGRPYFIVPGDHDFNWYPEHSLKNWQRIFSAQPYHSWQEKGNYFIFLNNADHEKGLGEEQRQWLIQELLKSKEKGASRLFVFMHIPLYNEQFPRKIMGEQLGRPLVQQQRQELLDLFADFGVDYLFFGDLHYFSQYFEPQTKLKMVTVGAACGQDCKNFLPQFVLVTVYKNGKISIIPKPYRELD